MPIMTITTIRIVIVVIVVIVIVVIVIALRMGVDCLFAEEKHHTSEKQKTTSIIG